MSSSRTWETTTLELRGSFIEDAVSLGALYAVDFLGYVMAYSVEAETWTLHSLGTMLLGVLKTHVRHQNHWEQF